MDLENGKWGFKTEYDGEEFRTKMEKRTALCLNRLNIDWSYEPKRFYFEDGMSYLPDFKLDKIEMWLEVKGNMIAEDKEKIEKFVKSDKKLLVLEPEDAYIYAGDLSKQDPELFMCSRCDIIYFRGNLEWYGCPRCGNYEGDHDIISKKPILRLGGLEEIAQEGSA